MGMKESSGAVVAARVLEIREDHQSRRGLCKQGISRTDVGVGHNEPALYFRMPSG